MTDPGWTGRTDYIDGLGAKWLAEVEEYREIELPGASAQPGQVHETLLEVRGSLDRVEEILSQAMSLRSGAEIRARELTEKADDALDRNITDRAKRAREFESFRERLAAASLDVLGERAAARSAQKQADMAVSVESRIRLAYRGLESLRSDLQTSLRHLAWESSLDR